MLQFTINEYKAYILILRCV